MSAAATADAARPATVTPPDAPGSVGCNVRIDRGWVPERDPISVAQVSAAAVATAPPNPAMSSERVGSRGKRRCQCQDGRDAAVGHHLDGIPFPSAPLFKVITGREPAEQARADEEREQHAAAADPRPRDDRPADSRGGEGAAGGEGAHLARRQRNSRRARKTDSCSNVYSVHYRR